MISPLCVRADANSTIGIGHVMRCLALAQAWHNKDGEVKFIGCIEPEGLRQRIAMESCGLVPLSACYPDPADLAAMRSFAHKKQEEQTPLGWLVLDGYHFDTNYQKAMRSIGWKVLVIDDMAHLQKYVCTILLNQNIDAHSRNYIGKPDSCYLLGPKYALLRREFKDYLSLHKAVPGVARNILVTMGGADPDNVTLKVIQALKIIKDGQFNVRVIIGPSNPHRQSIKKELTSASFEWKILGAGEEMPAHMQWADFAVSAGGSTTYELAVSGTPFLILIVADNQQGIAAGLHEAEASVNFGWSKDMKVNDLASKISFLLKNKKIRQIFSNNARKLVEDGNGAMRVAQKMIEVAA